MLRVTIEMIPHGVHPHQRLETIEIINDRSGTLDDGNYEAVIYDQHGQSWRQALVSGFPRKRLLSVDLLCRVLRAAIGARNAEPVEVEPPSKAKNMPISLEHYEQFREHMSRLRHIPRALDFRTLFQIAQEEVLADMIRSRLPQAVKDQEGKQ